MKLRATASTNASTMNTTRVDRSKGRVWITTAPITAIGHTRYPMSENDGHVVEPFSVIWASHNN